MRKFKIAVVGVGNVGKTMMDILEKSNLPIGTIMPMDTHENAGQELIWRNSKLILIEAKPDAFQNVDIALFSAGAEASLELAPEAVKRGCIVIDNSSAWRMDPDCPLVIPEVNPEALKQHRGIIANPNCSTIQMVVTLKPIHDAYKIKRVVVSTYQAVSGTGSAAIEELRQQTRAYVAGQSSFEKSVYPHQIAFNALPHIDSFMPDGYTKEEQKMVLETQKILNKNIQVSATCVRIPVWNGHSEAINIETLNPFDIENVRKLLYEAPGVTLQDNVSNNIYPMPIHTSGKDPVSVGRIRRDSSVSNGINLWCVADNLRKGAALNAVQIAEEIINRF